MSDRYYVLCLGSQHHRLVAQDVALHNALTRADLVLQRWRRALGVSRH